MIAASARLLQMPSDCTATLMSGLGGTTEKPIKYERAPVEEIFGSSEARGQALDTASKAAVKPLRNAIIVTEYVSKKRVPQTLPNGW
jgi:hypothetical protein